MAIENMWVFTFQMIITHLEFDILATAPTLHRTTICDEDLKIRNWVDKAMELLNKPTMNKIMGATTINQHHNRPMFDVNLDLQFCGAEIPKRE
jgi:hypothetical protein